MILDINPLVCCAPAGKQKMDSSKQESWKFLAEIMVVLDLLVDAIRLI
jgi:hypothetical protein